MNNKNSVIARTAVIIGVATNLWATDTLSPHASLSEPAKPMAAIEASKTIKSDFILPSHGWSVLTAKDLQGKHEIFDIKNKKEHIFLYRVSPGAKIGIKAHDDWEEVVIINGSLEWLDANGHTQQVLGTGAYVNRPPHVPHGPFKAGNQGCLMYVRMHS